MPSRPQPAASNNPSPPAEDETDPAAAANLPAARLPGGRHAAVQPDDREPEPGAWGSASGVAAERTAAPGGRPGWLAPLAVIIASLGALALVFALTRGGGTQEQAGPTSLAVPSSPTASPSSSSTPSSAPSSTSPSETTSTTSSSTPPARLPAGVKVCGAGLGAGPTTTCGFAKNVATAVNSADQSSPSFSVKAWSPTTKKDYRLACKAKPVTVCTGGRAAVIYIAKQE